MKLSESELRGLIRVTKKTKTTLYGYCPKCNKNEFGISLSDPHLFGCFRKKKCGFTGNIFTLLKFLGKNFTFSKKKFQGKTIEAFLEEFESINVEILPEVKMPIGFRRVDDDKYLRSRGFIDKDFETYVCGYTKVSKYDTDRIIVGFSDGLKTVGHFGRTLKEQEPKYKNSKSDFSKMLDGIDEYDYSEATLVEGLFDRINLRNCYEQLGIESRSLCSFGAKLSDYQINLLQLNGITKLNLFFDPDVYKVIKKSIAKIAHKFDEVNFLTTNDLNLDPGNMNVLEIGEAYLNRQNFIKFGMQMLPRLD